MKVKGQHFKITKKTIISSIVIILLFYIPGQLRERGEENFDILNYLSVYLFGGISAFSKWLTQSTIESHYWGDLNGTSFYTLKTWLSYLKIAEPPSNLHYEFTNIDNNNNTNVYSLFRPIIEDFGIIQVLILLYLFSFFSNYYYRKVMVLNRLEYIPVLVFLLTFSFFLFYTSIFSDFRIFIGTIFSVLILKTIFKIKFYTQ
jgi:oligosaccharide repeat unit polymerase